MIEIIKNTTIKEGDKWQTQYESDCINLKTQYPRHGVYVLCDYDENGKRIILYVGQGDCYKRIMRHSSKNGQDSKNNNWTHGFIIQCQWKILARIIEKLFIQIFDTKNNVQIDKIDHLVNVEYHKNSKQYDRFGN